VPLSVRKALGISDTVSIKLEDNIAFIENSDFIDGVVISKNQRRIKK